MICSKAINISVIIGSIMADSTKTLQFISVTALKIIFKWHTTKTRLWTHGLDAYTLYAWKLEFWTLGLCKPARLDSGRLDSGRLDAWTLEAWTLR